MHKKRFRQKRLFSLVWWKTKNTFADTKQPTNSLLSHTEKLLKLPDIHYSSCWNNLKKLRKFFQIATISNIHLAKTSIQAKIKQALKAPIFSQVAEWKKKYVSYPTKILWQGSFRGFSYIASYINVYFLIFMSPAVRRHRRQALALFSSRQ